MHICKKQFGNKISLNYTLDVNFLLLLLASIWSIIRIFDLSTLHSVVYMIIQNFNVFYTWSCMVDILCIQSHYYLILLGYECIKLETGTSVK